LEEDDALMRELCGRRYDRGTTLPLWEKGVWSI